MDNQRVEREKALYRYTSGLERGDFDAVAAVLEQAEEDEELERMLLEVNAAYRAEMEQGEAKGRPRPLVGLRSRLRHLRDRNAAFGRKGPAWRPYAVAGGILALVLGVGYLLLYASTGLYSVQDSLSAWEREQSPPQDSHLLPYVAQVDEPDVDRQQYFWGNANESDDGLVVDGENRPADTASDATVLPEERMVVYQGNLTLVVSDPRAAQASIEEMVDGMAGAGAHIVSLEERGGTGHHAPTIDVALRVPADRFDESMNELAQLALRVTGRSQTGQDVTEEYVDLQARLEGLETARQRLLEIMASAETTEDLLTIEEHLTRRETEIEAIQGRMQYLAQSSQLALITVRLAPDSLVQPVSPGWRPAESVRDSAESLLDTLQDVADFLIYFGIVILPWLAVGGLVVYGIVRFVLRRL
jgi:hypothetical protein